MIERRQTLAIDDDSDVVSVMLAAKDMARVAGLSGVKQTAMMTAVTELARNIRKYAQRGTVEISVVNDGSRRCVQVLAVDRGPGIADLQAALRDHYSTGNTFGLGLPGTRRLVDDFEIESVPGRGTRVLIRTWG